MCFLGNWQNWNIQQPLKGIIMKTCDMENAEGMLCNQESIYAKIAISKCTCM